MAEKILLVDDDLDTLRLVGLMLQRQGYEIRAANSGPQALAMVERENPDLILLDVMMPEMDGLEVTRRLRANPVTSSVPIILFTAKNQVDDKVLGFESGADDYLTKPVQPRELVAHMKAVLARRAKETVPHCDEFVVVAEPIPNTLIQSKALIEDLIARGIGIGHLKIALVNRFPSAVQLSMSQAQEKLGYNLTAMIPPAPELAYQASQNNVPMIHKQPDSLTAKQIGTLAGQLVTHTG